MRDRLKTLRRILNLYETMEEVCEAEAKRASAEVLQTEQAIGRQSGIAFEAGREEREAVEDGDCLERSYAVVRREIAGMKQQQLEHMLSEREERSAAARNRHIRSNQWRERMKQLVRFVETGVVEQELRREQVMADERYLARRGRRSKDKWGNDSKMSNS